MNHVLHACSWMVGVAWAITALTRCHHCDRLLFALLAFAPMSKSAMLRMSPWTVVGSAFASESWCQGFAKTTIWASHTSERRLTYTLECRRHCYPSDSRSQPRLWRSLEVVSSKIERPIQSDYPASTKVGALLPANGTKKGKVIESSLASIQKANDMSEVGLTLLTRLGKERPTNRARNKCLTRSISLKLLLLLQLKKLLIHREPPCLVGIHKSQMDSLRLAVRSTHMMRIHKSLMDSLGASSHVPTQASRSETGCPDHVYLTYSTALPHSSTWLAPC